jgi:hypothetical protein
VVITYVVSSNGKSAVGGLVKWDAESSPSVWGGRGEAKEHEVMNGTVLYIQ